ncbi:MAG TPA: nuclear transport factor 2 family protein [Vineibacter sp.]|nr:nuclear transport factor 2 family protein [Vineibacter sp.]
MSQESANLELIRNGYAMWNQNKEQSFQHWMDLLADNVQWRSLAGGATGMEFTSLCACKDDVRNYFIGLARDWEMQHYTPQHYLAQGDWVVMRGTCGWRHRRTNKTIDMPKADFLRLKDSKIVEFHEFFDTAAALAAARD